MSASSRRLFLLPSALLATFVPPNVAAVLGTRAVTASNLPAPISIAPDGNWAGVDGSWSTFHLRLGTPAQDIQALISFSSYQTWAVLPQGCQAAANYSSCAGSRGGIYNESASSSFDRIGIYDLAIENNLGLTGNAIYGYDAVALGGQDQQGPTLANTTVGGLAVTDFWLGVFGVNPKPSNFTDFNHGSPSYMTQLKEQNLTASVSAAYTAGAPYRSSGVLGSLTLGGYDKSKFVPNDVEFIFSADNSRDLLVAIQSISTPSSNETNPVATELLPQPVYAYIDSTVAEIWLPTQACQVFEDVFGLVYDDTTQLYLVDNALHTTLLQRNANITFQIGQGYNGSNAQITLPYAAFDLTASPPYQGVNNQTHYFPLRRAQNSSQYTLGRTFLQEAYLSVDWESQRFNVSQVAWDQNANSELVIIPPGAQNAVNNTYPGTGTYSTSSSNGLTGGAIAGIAVGAVAAVVLLGLLLMWFFRKRNREAKQRLHEHEKLDEADSDPNARGRQTNVYPKAELEGSAPFDHRRLLSGATSNGSVPNTPGSELGPGVAGYFPNRPNSASNSPSTPGAGEGTHSSSQSHYTNGNRSILVSPLSQSSSGDENPKPIIHEMAGDMPTIKEKDGKALTEKEAMAHREKVYNGVDSAPTSQTTINEPPRPPPKRRVDPENVAIVDSSGQPVQPRRTSPEELSMEREPRDFYKHRAFSFEEDRTAEDMGMSSEEHPERHAKEDSDEDLYS